MSHTELKCLNIEHLRGSVASFTLPFEKNKKLTVVYGDNGSGKSTICDAFEFLGKGNIGSLDNRGLGRTIKYWPTLGKKPGDVTVTLETTGNVQYRAKIINSNVVVDPIMNRPQVEVLRRSQILALVEAKPGERYEAIRRFIDVSGVETSEGTLRQLIYEIKKSREIAVACVLENQDAIRHFWESAGKQGTDPLAWGEIESKRNMESSKAEAIALNALQTAYVGLCDCQRRFEEATLEFSAAKNAIHAAELKSKKCVETISADAGELMGVLESARDYFCKHPSPDTCPLCESSENVIGLDQRISQRLGIFSDLQAIKVEVDVANTRYQGVKQQFEILHANYTKDAEEFNSVWSGFPWPIGIKMPASQVPQDIVGLETCLVETTHLQEEWKRAEADRQDKKQFIDALKLAVTTYVGNYQIQRDIDVLLPKLIRTVEIVEDERRNFTDSILSTIADEVGRLYELVHPGEGLNKISLELDSSKRASLEIGAGFCGQTGLPPQAYFSDSHLDTLGLCIFLALPQPDGAENTILVLDDVLASVDEPHVDRLVEMLYSEARRFRHCVITTHYRPWKHKLQWGWLKNGQCQFVELGRWTKVSGLIMIRTLPEIQKLEKLLNEDPPDPQLICSKAGIILEAALNFLTTLYECHVPRKPENRFTIGDLLPTIKGKLREKIRVDVLQIGSDGTKYYQTEHLSPILDELTKIAEARNVFGCHFKEIFFELLEEDALRFGREVFKLMQALVDTAEGWPKNSKSGEYWATSNETRRLYPLRKPL